MSNSLHPSLPSPTNPRISLFLFLVVSGLLVAFGYAMGTTTGKAADTSTTVKIEYRDLTWPEYRARIETEVKQDLGSDFQESTIRFTPKKTPEFPLYRQTPVNSETGVMVIERVGLELVGSSKKVDGLSEGISGTGTGNAGGK